ncbi:MAG TPA: hypothetical protein VG097_16465 [Gemmata sp.]|nr:hypothetical protein [Gemmata sp.]
MPRLQNTTEKAACGCTSISEKLRRHDPHRSEINGVDVTEWLDL